MTTGRLMTGRLMSAVLACVILVNLAGCASIDELRQSQMSQRRLEAEKANMEQQLFDSRTAVESLRTRADSLDDQLSVKDQLIANLTRENDGLESKFRKAQDVLEKIADRPIGPVGALAGSLPADLDAALRQLAAEYPSSVSYDSGRGTIKWKSDLLFAFASDIVKDSAKKTLGAFSQIMKTPAATNFDIIVVGHTDGVPIRKPQTKQKHPTNTHLSVHRSIAVANQLQTSGLSASRIGVMGFGEQRPIAPNDSAENRARNRRVEMYIVPSGSFSVGASAQPAMTFTGPDPASTTK